MSQNQDTIVTALMEQLIAEGPDGMAQVFTALFNLALRLDGAVALTAVAQNLAAPCSGDQAARSKSLLTNRTSPVTPGSIRMQWRRRIMRIISKPLIVA